MRICFKEVKKMKELIKVMFFLIIGIGIMNLLTNYLGWLGLFISIGLMWVFLKYFVEVKDGDCKIGFNRKTNQKATINQ